MFRFKAIFILFLLLFSSVLAREDTGVEPGLNIDFSGGKSLNRVGSSLSYTFPIGSEFTYRLTLDQRTQNEPQSRREADSRALRFDLFYEPVKTTSISCYYEQIDYDSKMETQEQYQIQKSRRMGTTAYFKPSDAFNADLNAYFTTSDINEGSFYYDYGFREFIYDSLSANTDLKVNYQISKGTRLALNLSGSREVRNYPTQPSLDSEYYVGSMNSNLVGNYTLGGETTLELRHLFNGTLYRDIRLMERNQNTMQNNLTLVTNFAAPFGVKGILTVDGLFGTTTFMEKEMYLEKYYYWIYPELDPVPGYRNRTPWWPLYDLYSRGINWKLQLNWDPTRDTYLRWALSQDTMNKRYYNDEGELPPERFAIANSVMTNIKNTMSTDAQIGLGRNFLLNLRHRIIHDDFTYPISSDRDTISLYNDVTSSVKWKLTDKVSFNTNFSVGFDQTRGGFFSTLPRSNDIRLTFGSEVRLIEGLRVGLRYTLTRMNSRTDDLKSGNDALSRELVVEPVFSISRFWSLDFSGSFKETVKFPVGESVGSMGLDKYWRVTARLNIYPTETLAFDVSYRLNSSISTTTIGESDRTYHSWSMTFSYKLMEKMVIYVDTSYYLYEYDTSRNSFNIGMRIRTTL